nr:Uncharacterised protein [Streptococcus thermophilus]
MTRPTNDAEGNVNASRDVSDATVHDIAAVLDAESLEYRIEEADAGPDEPTRTVLRTGFVNAAMVFAFDDARLVFESVWRGEFTPMDASSLLFAVNEYNQTRFAPTLRFFQSEENTLVITGIRSLDVSQGLSGDQLGSFVITSIDATLQAFDFLAESFPTAVTWEE